MTSSSVTILYGLKDKDENGLLKLRKIVNKNPQILDELPPLYKEAALRLLQEKRGTEPGRG